MSNLSHHLNKLYNPSISDLELDEHHGRDRPVIYLDQALATLEHIRDELLVALPEPMTANLHDKQIYPRLHYRTKGYNQALKDVREAITKYCEGGKDAK